MNTRFTIEEENIVAIYAEDSRETTLENILAAMPYVADFRHRAPVLFLSLRGQLESRFCGFEYTLSSMSFSCAGSRRNTGVFSP